MFSIVVLALGVVNLFVVGAGSVTVTVEPMAGLT